MYNNKFVACVKVGGKILKEKGSNVFIPFGSPYTILLKNLESRKALVNVSIDGRSVIKELVIEPNSSTELKRFVEGYGWNSGPSFKFIEKTEKISDFRGDKVDDGLVRIEFRFEKEKPIVREVWTNYKSCWTRPCNFCHDPYRGNCYGCVHSPFISYGHTTTTSLSKNITKSSVAPNISVGEMDLCGPIGNVSCNASDMGQVNSFSAQAQNFNDAGITVEGAHSSQQFTYATIGTLEEQSHVIILQLKGEIGKAPISEPILARTKIRCKTCGEMSSAGAAFCSGCGTNLQY